MGERLGLLKVSGDLSYPIPCAMPHALKAHTAAGQL